MTLVSVPTRLTHDISLEEFEDEDLSEITDECGISLQCKDTLSLRVRAGSEESEWLGGWTQRLGHPDIYKGACECVWHSREVK